MFDCLLDSAVVHRRGLSLTSVPLESRVLAAKLVTPREGIIGMPGRFRTEIRYCDRMVGRGSKVVAKPFP